MSEVRVSTYGSLATDDGRLWHVRGQTDSIRAHWAACGPWAAMSAAAADAGFGLIASSAWRPMRWKSYEQYIKALIHKYQHRTDLYCKHPSRATKCPCFPKHRRACLYLAYQTRHQTGLCFDLRCHGLIASSKTIAKQRKTQLYRWLCEHAEEFGFQNYTPEPWHWELPIPKEIWLLPGPESVGSA